MQTLIENSKRDNINNEHNQCEHNTGVESHHVCWSVWSYTLTHLITASGLENSIILFACGVCVCVCGTALCEMHKIEG